MSASRSAVIQFTDQQEAQSELQFQNLSHQPSTSGVATLDPSESYTSFPESAALGDVDEKEELLGGENKPSASFWEFEYYQSFFNVDTTQVVRRIIWSMIPHTGRATYLERYVRPSPDLYGPFWITATLIFSTAISANIADYLSSQGENNKIWHYDFHKISLAATAIYSYAIALPFILWGLTWYRQSSIRYTFLEILCVYGYSLFIYIPISILWVIQVPFFQWILVIIGAALSGSVLLHTFWPVVREENKKIAVVVLCLILFFHTLLAVGFVAYFFRPSHSDASPLAPLSTNEFPVTVTTMKFDPAVEFGNHGIIPRKTHVEQNKSISSDTLKPLAPSTLYINHNDSGNALKVEDTPLVSTPAVGGKLKSF